MKNTDFALKKEENDYILMEDFNKVLKLRELGKCPQNDVTDCSGYTEDGRYVSIELKERNICIDTYDSIFIETHKCGDMLLDYVIEGKIPLYINFLNNGYVVLYNLARLRHRPKKVAKRIYSELYQGFELAKREELPLEDAFIYKKENDAYKLVRKPK